VLYVVFFIPGIAALIYSGYTFAMESWAIGEHSTVTAEGPPVYQFKAIIPVAGVLVMLQGIAEIADTISPSVRTETASTSTSSLAQRRRSSSSFAINPPEYTTIPARRVLYGVTSLHTRFELSRPFDWRGARAANVNSDRLDSAAAAAARGAYRAGRQRVFRRCLMLKSNVAGAARPEARL
jgi:hypothetical protein